MCIRDSAPAAEAPAAAGPSGKTGWEALEKWVGGEQAANGADAESEPAAVAAGAGEEEPSSGGGFMGFLKRLFGGK